MKRVAPVVVGVLLAAYPAAVYFGLTGGASARVMALVLLAALIVVVAPRLWRAKREDLRVVLPGPLAAAACAVLGAVLDDRRFVLALPVLINLVLLVSFGATLRRGPTMIERFARMQEPELSEAKVAHCRAVTWVWCVFFVINGATAAVLAVRGPLEWWALWVGALAYLVMGALFAGEWVVRTVRFGR